MNLFGHNNHVIKFRYGDSSNALIDPGSFKSSACDDDSNVEMCCPPLVGRICADTITHN